MGEMNILVPESRGEISILVPEFVKSVSWYQNSRATAPDGPAV
jgi:hypothetical protein